VIPDNDGGVRLLQGWFLIRGGGSDGCVRRGAIHGDLTMKERALGRLTPPNTRPGRYQPPDRLLAFLEAL
jgi:hypothetical protein